MGINAIIGLIKYLFFKKKRKPTYDVSLLRLEEFQQELDKIKYFSNSELEYLKSNYKETYLYVNKYLNLEKYRKEYNEKYVQQELEKQDSFLSNIDGKSLDIQQRKAVIVEEDNNLIVAGAGSGKTLTIAAKVSYLVNCLNINPEKILLITFTNKAAKEMRDRIVTKLGIDVEVKTFHSLGNQIIAQTRKEKLSVCENSQNIIKTFIADKLKHDIKTLEKLTRFYGNYLNVPENLDSFENFGSYLESQRHIDLKTLKAIQNEYYAFLDEKGIKVNTYVTIKDERVKSTQELAIANFLFLNGIRYEYEPNYVYSTSNQDKRQYKPDFYLVDYNIYIEHFGINEAERTPWLSEFEEQEYLNGMKWKRNLHRENNTRLYETYSYQFSDGSIFERLKEDLTRLGVEFKEIDDKELLDVLEGLKKQVGFNELIKLMNTFLNLFKSNGYNTTNIKEMMKAAKKNNNYFIRKRELLFFEIFQEFYSYYQEILEKDKSIDFNDMINEATKLVEQGDSRLDYQYIIIDEYQDISKARYRLIKAIKDQTNAKIMAVGDDWQSIYRFAGSDIKLFTDFEKMFGASEILKIERTYRNSQQVIDLAGSFVIKNDIQIKKELKSDKQLNQPINIIYYNDQEQALLSSLGSLAQTKEAKSVMLLGRNNNDLDFIRKKPSPYFKVIFKNGEEKVYCNIYEHLDITFSTVHKSKGLEADEVIILNCANATCGFPNKISDDLLLRYVLTGADEYPYGEERRLFYVALTRTRNRCILLAPEQQSEFIKELINDYKVPFEVMDDCQFSNVKCPRCKTGNLVMRENRMGKKFLGCSNYPGCNKTINDITVLNDTVICPKCGGYLVDRQGRYGIFKGCTNYNKCTYTETVE